MRRELESGECWPSHGGPTERGGGGEGGGKFIQGLNAVNEQDPERERAKGIRHALKREREREREREIY